MKFNGKQLFELGVPKNKIKFFIGREFGSIEEIRIELQPVPKTEVIIDETWCNWMWDTFHYLPCVEEKQSKSAFKRLFENGCVLIDNQFIKPSDPKTKELPDYIIFFPYNKKKRNSYFGNSWHFISEELMFDIYPEMKFSILEYCERLKMDFEDLQFWHKHGILNKN